MTLPEAISQLERHVLREGSLDREQARAVVHLLWDMADANDIQFAIADLLGALGEERKDAI